MKRQGLVLFSVLALSLSIKHIKAKGTKGKVVEKTKPSIKDITAHKPRKYQLDSAKKKHQVLLLATPSNISSLRRLKSDSKRVSNKLREAAADRQGIHRLMSRHPFNILLKNMEFPLSRPYSSHKPKHLREFTPVAYHSDYQRAPWHHLRYRPRHPLLYALMPVNRYGSPFRNGYRHYFKQYALPWYGGMPWHRRFPNQYAFVSRPGLGLGYNSMLRHGTIGKWRFRPARKWYPYSLYRRMNQRVGISPKTIIIEKILTPSKVAKAVMSSQRRIAKESPGKASTAKHGHRAIRPFHHSPLSRLRILPFGFRIQRYKIRLVPLKQRVKHSKSPKKMKNPLKKWRSKNPKKIFRKRH
ncbi:uncharacterized protein [Acropora muricata]|uniref:uncharacterized protein n=1 Tax=Acropora muricata TaxID=159855 RepID=UPI0034E50215